MARTSAALLVDPDLKGLESLVYGFQGVDWRSTACPTPETAALLVKASAADILVVAAREPHNKTLALLRQLRSSEETRTLPVLVIAPASLRASVLECGSIDFLPTPVFIRDVIAASRILVSLGTHHGHEQGREPKIDGTLADLGFFSIIRVMSGLLRSGVLQVERANRRGEILFSEGEIAGAQMGSLQGPPAIHHLLLWEDAKVELRLRAVARRGQFNRRFDQIMDEAERFVRDYAHAIRGIGPSSSVYAKDDGKLATAIVPPAVAPVLRLVDGRRTLTDIIDESPFRVFDTVRILTRLVEMGVVARQKARDVTSEPRSPLQAFWETARIANPEDNVAPASAKKPPSAHVGEVDMRIGEPNRRTGQRRASAETPVFGTPIVGVEAARPPLAGDPATAAPAAPVGQATGASQARVSGTIDLPATGDRRQAKSDRRNRPSVTIDAALVEVATTAAGSPVEPAAAPAEPPAGSGHAAGTLQVGSSSGQRRSAAVAPSAAGGTSIEIDPGLPSESSATASKDSPTVPLRRPGTPAASSETGKTGSTGTGTTPAPVATTTASQGVAASAVVEPALASSHAPGATPSAGESGSPTAAPGEGARTARVTGTLSIAPSQRSVAARTASKGVSVELDPVLMAELGRLEKATTPIGPPESAEPPRAESVPVAAPAQPGAGGTAPRVATPTPSPPKSGHAGKVAGTLSVSSSSRSSANALKTPSRGHSVALDPALVAEAQKLDAPKFQPAAAPTHASASVAEPRAGSQGAVSGKGQARSGSSDRTAPAAARPAPHASDDGDHAGSQSSRQTGRISGAFNAIERDFFAREADLYKPEAEDNFADLEEPARQGNGKTTPSRGPSKRRA